MDPKKVTRGHLAEMLRQFSATHRLIVGEPGNSERILVLANLVEVSRNTAEGWFKKYTIPTAVRACKLQLLLSLCGFEADERSRLSSVVRTFADTLSTVVTIEEAEVELGTTSKSLLFWIRGDVGPKQMQSVIDFNQKHAERRQSKIRAWKRALEENGFIASEPAAAKAAPVSDVSLTPNAGLASASSVKIADSLVSIFNDIANIAMVGINPDDLSEDAKQHIAFTAAELFNKLGITPEVIERVRRRQEQASGNLNKLSEILLKGRRK